MDRMDRTEKDDTQKAKVVFLSLAALVVILMIWSLISANKARVERDAVRQEIELIKQDNAKLEQIVKDLQQENETLKNKLKQAQTKPKPKATAKKKTKPAKSTSTKKSSKPAKTE